MAVVLVSSRKHSYNHSWMLKIDAIIESSLPLTVCETITLSPGTARVQISTSVRRHHTIIITAKRQSCQMMDTGTVPDPDRYYPFPRAF